MHSLSRRTLNSELISLKLSHIFFIAFLNFLNNINEMCVMQIRRPIQESDETNRLLSSMLSRFDIL